jgi:hypothetical protein
VEVPKPYSFGLVALAAWRTWKLVGDDRILDRPRDWAVEKLGGTESVRGTYWSDFIRCPYCAGAHISFAWWLAWQRDQRKTEIAAVPLAVSAVVGLLGTVLDALTED